MQWSLILHEKPHSGPISGSFWLKKLIRSSCPKIFKSILTLCYCNFMQKIRRIWNFKFLWNLKNLILGPHWGHFWLQNPKTAVIFSVRWHPKFVQNVIYSYQQFQRKTLNKWTNRQLDKHTEDISENLHFVGPMLQGKSLSKMILLRTWGRINFLLFAFECRPNTTNHSLQIWLFCQLSWFFLKFSKPFVKSN